MDSPKNGTYQSLKGVSVVLGRIPTPGGKKPTIEIRYNAPVRVSMVWFPDFPHAWARVGEVLENFKNDRDNLGREFLLGPKNKFDNCFLRR